MVLFCIVAASFTKKVCCMRVSCWVGYGLLASMVLGAAAIAAPTRHPGFTCPRPDDSDILAAAPCADPAMAKAELDIEKVFHAHLGQAGSHIRQV
ncbi:hypothetical protein LU298_11045 [Komagataeibacter intermedius]|nr:hypothetical protein [Komagataeibacter intermedius]MCF3637032.1 hypothetical protein [Komagataeibacter intermedius]